MSKFYRREMHFLKGFDGSFITFDVGTSSVVYLDSLGYKILSFGPEIEENSILYRYKSAFPKETILKTIRRLIEVGVLSPEPQRKKTVKSGDFGEIVIGGISFNITHRCNMRCGYCFGGGGCYGGPAIDMNGKVLKAGIDYLFANCHNLGHCIISFFGGEPFLNWKMMRWGIIYAQSIANQRGIALTFFITTNGTLLTREKLDFLNRRNIKLIVSIDGPKKIHDQERKFIGGSGSYDIVERNVKLALQRYPDMTIQARPTITPDSCGKIKKIYRHFKTMGIEKMHARPESRYGKRPGFSSKEYQTLASGLEELTIDMIDASNDGEYWGLINVLKFLNMLYFGVVRHDYCGAGTSVISISPDGSVSPCPRFTGEKEFLLGNILTGLDNDKRLVFLNNSVDNRLGCQNCWARYICGGGCFYMHWTATGDYRKNDTMWCEWTRRSIEIAIKAYARLQKSEEDRMKEFFIRHTPLLSDFGDGANELLVSILKERR